MPRHSLSWGLSNISDEARVRDYKTRESRRTSQQDRDEAQMEYLTRIRRKESEYDYAQAALAAQKLNMGPLPHPSGSARYECKSEAQTSRDRALEQAQLQRHRSAALETKNDALARAAERAERAVQVERANAQRIRREALRASLPRYPPPPALLSYPNHNPYAYDYPVSDPRYRPIGVLLWDTTYPNQPRPRHPF